MKNKLLITIQYNAYNILYVVVRIVFFVLII